ncbi:hypothetical protein ACOTJC_28920 [Achromobacter xylosoxidans]|nr:hypothetical protein [Achromobacter xylosoxidans]
MTKEEYEEMNMFSRWDIEESEEGAEIVRRWQEEDESTSSSMFDH